MEIQLWTPFFSMKEGSGVTFDGHFRSYFCLGLQSLKVLIRQISIFVDFTILEFWICFGPFFNLCHIWNTLLYIGGIRVKGHCGQLLQL